MYNPWYAIQITTNYKALDAAQVESKELQNQLVIFLSCYGDNGNY